MFTLKRYQREAISSLGEFLDECHGRKISDVFKDYVRSQGIKENPKYHDEFGDSVPCVCIRIPTGGGKTVIGVASIKTIDDRWTKTASPVVLWLTPSETITQQTLRALNSPDHPYRKLLEKDFRNVKVVSISEIDTLQPTDFFDTCLVIISNIQTFNIKNTDKRKVYENDENLLPFFTNVSVEAANFLDKISEKDVNKTDSEGNPVTTVLTKNNIGGIKTSLTNLLALHHPIIVVDEAHNNRTHGFFSTLNRVKPSVVLELTATPDPLLNNTIFQVSAWDLKMDNMIKMPIMLRGYQTGWDTCVSESVTIRNQLEPLADKEKNYIRPIVLIQAQEKGKDPTPQAVKDFLIQNQKIPEKQIAIATGEIRELKDVDLFSEKCPIRYIITVKALQEGWDCSFAYVLCSLQNLQSAKGVEQLLGRVLRLPYAEKPRSEKLSQAYASVISEETFVAANTLKDKLVSDLGYDKLSANEMVEVDKRESSDPCNPILPLPELSGASPCEESSSPTQTKIYFENKQSINVLQKKLEEKGLEKQVKIQDISVQEGSSKVVVTMPKRLENQQISILRSILSEGQSDKTKASITTQFFQNESENRRQTAIENQQKVPDFTLPLLCFLDEDESIRPLTGQLLGPWVPLDYDEPFNFSISTTVSKVEVTFNKNKRLDVNVDSEEDAELPIFDAACSEEELIGWLVHQVSLRDVVAADMMKFIKKILKDKLIGELGYHLSSLVRNKSRLAEALKKNLEKRRSKAAENSFSFQTDRACPDKEDSYEFRFEPGKYQVRNPYDEHVGGIVFEKHYYPQIEDLYYKSNKGKGTGTSEEYECALAIEKHPEVTVWVRNVERSEYSFRLPLSGGRYFYPDFVAKLKDGRILVVEYKGQNLTTNDDSKEKQFVGEIWEENSNGRALFLWAIKEDEFGRRVYDQISNKLKDNRGEPTLGK